MNGAREIIAARGVRCHRRGLYGTVTVGHGTCPRYFSFLFGIIEGATTVLRRPVRRVRRARLPPTPSSAAHALEGGWTNAAPAAARLPDGRMSTNGTGALVGYCQRLRNDAAGEQREDSMQKGLITSPHQAHPSTHHPGLEHEHEMEEQKAEPLWTSARLHGWGHHHHHLPRMEPCPDRAGGVANNDRVRLGRGSNCTLLGNAVLLDAA